MRVLAHLTSAKLQKLACARTVARDFGVHTQESKHTRHMRDARHKLALGLPHYTCGVTTGTIAVRNEIQLLCSLLASLYVVYEHCLKILLKRSSHTEYSRISLCR